MLQCMLREYKALSLDVKDNDGISEISNNSYKTSEKNKKKKTKKKPTVFSQFISPRTYLTQSLN